MPYLELAFNLPLKAVYTYHSEEKVDIGCRVQTQLGRRKLTGFVVGLPDEPPAEVGQIKSIDRIIDRRSLFSSTTLDLARWMADLTMCSLGEALASMIPGGRRESRDIPEAADNDDIPRVAVLSKEQSSALGELEKRENGWFYLHGETGSGKTEVFLRLAETALAKGRGVIYLVPEIALSHHLVEGLSNRFPNLVAVLHSGLTPSRRLKEWRKIQDGDARFVLGARSAVFAPIEDLGLIIIDEEHESSYKSSSNPRYHARQLAMRRCLDSDAALIMGSATPSVEAWEMMSRDRLQRLELSGRPGGGAVPVVKTIDMSGESGLLSAEMLRDMSRVLDEDRQVLLFLNRRGFSHNYICSDCGEGLSCSSCSVPMTYHKSRNAMVCHYCGQRRALPNTCPHCGSLQMRAAGFGTEKIEEEIQNLFPEKRVVRLDADSARKKGVLPNTLRDFRNGSIDVLLGTQMVAKGLNAPKLKLAVILSADSSLNIPDFRSPERTFSLIVQVAGRVGRFSPDGEVVIQSYRPDSYPVRYAAEGRIADFYEFEIEQRKLLGFPPMSRLFRIVVRGRIENRLRSCIDELSRSLSDVSGDWELMGPAECPIGMISGEYRRHIILRSKSFDRTHAALRTAVESLKMPHGVRLEIDVDPVNLL